MGPQGGLVAIDRAVSVIEALRRAGSLSLADIARATELSEPTALRYLGALRKHHVVARDPKDGTYRLGVRLHEWGQAAPVDVDPRAVAERPLLHLSALIGETVELAGVEGRQLVVLSAFPSGHAVSKIAHVGDIEEWHCTSVGKAILSRADDEFVTGIVSGLSMAGYTPSTITSVPALRADLALARERGYAVDEEESERGLRCVGVAFRDRSGRYAYALSASGPVYRMTRERQSVVAERLQETAREIEIALGGPAENIG
jgi:IclR family acetate operon transcriptional repressor